MQTSITLTPLNHCYLPYMDNHMIIDFNTLNTRAYWQHIQANIYSRWAKGLRKEGIWIYWRMCKNQITSVQCLNDHRPKDKPKPVWDNDVWIRTCWHEIKTYGDSWVLLCKKNWEMRATFHRCCFLFRLWRAEVLSVWQREGCVVRFYSNAPVLLVNQHLLLSPGRPTVTHDRCHLRAMSKRHLHTCTHTHNYLIQTQPYFPCRSVLQITE